MTIKHEDGLYGFVAQGSDAIRTLDVLWDRNLVEEAENYITEQLGDEVYESDLNSFLKDKAVELFLAIGLDEYGDWPDEFYEDYEWFED